MFVALLLLSDNEAAAVIIKSRSVATGNRYDDKLRREYRRRDVPRLLIEPEIDGLSGLTNIAVNYCH